MKNGKKLKLKKKGKDQAFLHQLIVSNKTVKVREILWAFSTAETIEINQ